MVLGDFIHVATLGIETAMFVSAPVLLFGLAAGIAVSMFQAATQINDSSLAFIPKIAAVGIALGVFGSWMISRMASFAIYSFNQIPNVTF
jgi:flagellar biosynthesis protein FliQ